MAFSLNAVASIAASSAITLPIRREIRLASGVQLWHLLSLDAPTVAMLWTWFLARTNHIALPVTAILAMGTAVWILYAADRLLDARAIRPKAIARTKAVIDTLDPSKGQIPCISLEVRSASFDDLEPRHYFHRRHQSAFRLGILIASIVLAALLPSIALQSVRLYLILGAFLSGYFVLIHLKKTNPHRLPKELAVGVFFSAATFIPTIARNPALRFALFPGATLFAALCSLNCLFIYSWEHPASSPQPHPTTRIALRFLPLLAIAAAIIGLLLSITGHTLPSPICLACSIAALLLLLLDKCSHRLVPVTLRAAADLCLLTPLFLIPLLHR